MAKIAAIIFLVHRLGGSGQLYQPQILYANRVLNMIRKEVLPGILYHPLSPNIRWLGNDVEEGVWETTRTTLQYARELRAQPLRLLDLSLISIRKAVCGQHFEASSRQLARPKKMKAFVRADIMPTLLAP